MSDFKLTVATSQGALIAPSAVHRVPLAEFLRWNQQAPSLATPDSNCLAETRNGINVKG